MRPDWGGDEELASCPSVKLAPWQMRVCAPSVFPDNALPMLWIAPTETDSLTATLEKRLWDSADQVRSNSGFKAQEYSGPNLCRAKAGDRLVWVTTRISRQPLREILNFRTWFSVLFEQARPSAVSLFWKWFD
jgi:hypothetical protein